MARKSKGERRLTTAERIAAHRARQAEADTIGVPKPKPKTSGRRVAEPGSLLKTPRKEK